MNLVISGPSGSGKGTLINLLLIDSDFKKSVSYTTRTIREGEIQGKDYNFVSHEKFKNLLNDDYFFEAIEYGNNFYGIPKQNISLMYNEKNIIFDVIPTTGINIKKESSDTCLVYIIPPNYEELAKRRGNRGNERIKDDIIQLNQAKQNYDYIIINDDIKKAYEELKMIISIYQNNTIIKKLDFMDTFFDNTYNKVYLKNDNSLAKR